MQKIELRFIDENDKALENIELAEVPEEVYEEMFSTTGNEKKAYFNYIDRMTFEEEWDIEQVNKHKDKILIALTHLQDKYKPVWAEVQ